MSCVCDARVVEIKRQEVWRDSDNFEGWRVVSAVEYCPSCNQTYSTDALAIITALTNEIQKNDSDE